MRLFTFIRDEENAITLSLSLAISFYLYSIENQIRSAGLWSSILVSGLDEIALLLINNSDDKQRRQRQG